MGRKYPKVTAKLREVLDQEYLKKWFVYRGGKLYWALSKRGVNAGGEAGNLSVWGNWKVMVCGHTISRGRIVWVMHHGWIPSNVFIAHMNNNNADDRIENLKLMSGFELSWGKGLNKLNRSGYKGVSYSKRKKKYKAAIRIYGKDHYLGLFKTAKEASEAYEAARRNRDNLSVF